MGQTKTKMVKPDDGNVENEQIIEQAMKQKRMEKVEQKLVKKPNILSGIGESITSSPTLKPLISMLSKTDNVIKTEETQKEAENAEASNSQNVDKQKDEEEEINDAHDDNKDDHEEEEEEEKSAAGIALDKSKYAVNYDHVKVAITEFTDSMKPTDEHCSHKLLEIFDTIEVSKDDLTVWKGDYGSTISSKQDAKNKMKSVIDYAENDSSCTPAVKTRLRCVTKLILEAGKADYTNYKGIMLLIASHGNVCNVMKEVAINNAYGICTGRDAMENILKAQTLKEQILRVLRDYRVLLVEEVFHFFKFTNNTHYIAGFHNTIAAQIGVTPYNDPNICYPSSSTHKEWKNNLDKRYFAEFYTLQKILNYILVQIDTKKIGYQKIVAWFEQHCPPNIKKTDFLALVIDIDTGKINENYMCWLLEKMDVLLIKDEDWKEIEKCWS